MLNTELRLNSSIRATPVICCCSCLSRCREPVDRKSCSCRWWGATWKRPIRAIKFDALLSYHINGAIYRDIRRGIDPFNRTYFPYPINICTNALSPYSAGKWCPNYFKHSAYTLNAVALSDNYSKWVVKMNFEMIWEPYHMTVGKYKEASKKCTNSQTLYELSFYAKDCFMHN